MPTDVFVRAGSEFERGAEVRDQAAGSDCTDPATERYHGQDFDARGNQHMFVALPVIPELRLTDMGLVDVTKFDFVDLFV